ncbi:MAG: hypothetical protein QM831_05160 [Kofleriaceae bacterium]
MKAVFVLALFARIAAADDSFEARAQTAQPLHRIESLVWALTSACDQGDDVQQRQCKRVRDARAKDVAAGTWLVEADADAFDVGAWNETKKSLPINLAACIRCSGVEVDGKTYFITGSGATKLEDKKVRGTLLHDNARTFADAQTAAMWAKAVSKVKVEMVVRLAPKWLWRNLDKQGISLDVIAYRVVVPCDGTVILANPPSSPVEPDKKQCPLAPEVTVAEAEAGPAVEQLTAQMIDEAMQPVLDQAWRCYERIAVTGKAKLKIQVSSDGGIAKYEQQGDFANTPMGACIDKAISKAHFPHVKKAKTTVVFPITIQP